MSRDIYIFVRIRCLKHSFMPSTTLNLAYSTHTAQPLPTSPGAMAQPIFWRYRLMVWRLMADRFSPVVARLGRLEQQQGVGAGSLKMLTGGIRWYHLGGGYWWCSRTLSPTI